MNTDLDNKIRAAFENSSYEWRTLRGVAIECGTSIETVLSYVSNHGEEIVKSSAKNANGEQLYTSRRIYRNRTGIGARLSSIIRNRGA